MPCRRWPTGAQPRNRACVRTAAVGRTACRALPGHRPRIRPADGTRPAAVHHRVAPGRADRARRFRSRHGVLRGAAGERGCHSDAHEQAKWFGDDIALKATKYQYDQRSLRGAVAAMRLIGAGGTPLHRARVGAGFLLGAFREIDDMIGRHAELARRFAEELGLPDEVRDAVAASYERWDGKGWPGRLRAEQIPVAARLSQLAEFVEVAYRLGGPSAAAELARRRAGTQFDPYLARLV